MIPALWAAIIAANISRQSSPEPYVDCPWWMEKPIMARWPRFLLWLIRRRTRRRSDGKTWEKLDDWLWEKYFMSVNEKKQK